MRVSRFNQYSTPVLIVCAALVSWFATIWGAGFFPDSVVYLRAARALVDGQNIFQIGTHFPPGYSLLWAGGMLLGGDDFFAARVIGISSQVLMLAGFAAVLARHVASNILQGLILAALVVSATYALIFWMAWSEASFLAAMIWGIYFALEISVGGRQIFHSRMFLLCLMAMLLLRYASLPLVGGLLLYLLFCRGRPDIAEIGRAITAGLIIVAPVAIWLSISSLAAEQGVARQLAFHPPGETHWQQLLATVADWGGGHPATAMAGDAGLPLAGSTV